MLLELAIKNFAIINDIRIPFSGGLTVLTGETGAGKSIIIEAMNLLLGGRASADLVRTGEDSAELEASFDIDPGSNAARIMAEQGLDPAEGLMIRRTVSLDGKHKIFINSRLSTMQLLKRVTENLAGISSQHAHQGLLSEDVHLDILDRYAGTYPLRNQVQERHENLVPLMRELIFLRANQKKLDEEAEFLKYQIQEIEEAKLKPGEDVELEAERIRLKSGTDLYQSVTRTVEDLYTRENSVIEILGAMKLEMEKKGAIDPRLLARAETLNQVVLELEDLTEELRVYADTIDLNPDALDETEARLDRIKKLKRKYGGSMESLFDRYHAMKKQVDDSGNTQERIERLESEARRISGEMGKAALDLSGKRQAAALSLARLAEKEFQDLEMGSTRFLIALHTTPATETDDLFSAQGKKILPTGLERACFVMAPNPGEEPRPLSRIASGGELSRVVLALKAILSETESLGTLVFDEVDAGIGGKTSEKVGRKLKSLAGNYQVICITHLAQIAKYGSFHFRIAKQVADGRTTTTIAPLTSKEDRVMEIARMIGGETITPATLDHARELLSASGGM
ncbi:MAG: DNA repair protein RecN [Pseudomonadota bacterium]